MDSNFDFIDGNLGYVIQRGPTDDNSNDFIIENDTSDIIIEVHYIGTPANILKFEVDDITGISKVDYVSNNIHLDSGESPENKFDFDVKYDEFGEQILFSDSDSWSGQQGGIDPVYGLISIPLSSSFISSVGLGIGPGFQRDAISGTDGSLNMQSSLMYDIIINTDNTNPDIANTFLNIASMSKDFESLAPDGVESMMDSGLNNFKDPITQEVTNLDAGNLEMKSFFSQLETVDQNGGSEQTQDQALRNADNDMYEYVGRNETLQVVDQMPLFNISYTSPNGDDIIVDYNFFANQYGNSPGLSSGQKAFNANSFSNDMGLIGEYKINLEYNSDGGKQDWSFSNNIMIKLVDDFYKPANYINSNDSQVISDLVGDLPTGELLNQSGNFSYSSAEDKISYSSILSTAEGSGSGSSGSGSGGAGSGSSGNGFGSGGAGSGSGGSGSGG